MEELPPVTAGDGGISVTLEALRNRGVVLDSRMDGIESDPSTTEFVTSAMTSQSITNRGRPGPLSTKKRASDKRMEQISLLSDVESNSDESMVSTRSTTSMSLTTSGVKRKKGLPPTTGEYVGRAAAMQEAAKMERELMEIRAERELVEMASEAKITRSKAGFPSLLAKTIAAPTVKKTRGSAADDTDPVEEGPRALQRKVLENLEVVTTVATKSSNLKALREAAKSIATAVEMLAHRTKDEQLKQLERSNELLKRNNVTLKQEVGDLREEIREMREALGGLKKKTEKLQLTLSTSRDMEISGEEDPPLQELRTRVRKRTTTPATASSTKKSQMG